LTYPTERVIGFVQSANVIRGSIAYITTERIIVNKSKGQLSLRLHLFTALLVGFAPFVSAQVALAILLVVAAVIAFELLRKRRSRKWPSVKEVEGGVRQFEVRKGQVFSIELKRPGRIRNGYVRITPLSTEVFNLKIAGKKAFRVMKNLVIRFEPNRVKVD